MPEVAVSPVVRRTMFHNRPCGCKGRRSCLECEQKYGAWCTAKDVTEQDKAASLVYCPLCDLAWPGWDGDSWTVHPRHEGVSVRLPGVRILLDFVSEAEEAELLQHIDEVPWDTSQSGRLKQNYGPKCNFKKRKAKVDGFTGFPQFTQFVQARFNEVDLLRDFQTVEQCSLDYTISRGASIDPHIDDCWIWGERIPTLSLLSDSVLTLNRYQGEEQRYNLPDVKTYPSVVDEEGKVKDIKQLEEFYKDCRDDSVSGSDGVHQEPVDNANKTIGNAVAKDVPEDDCGGPVAIRVPEGDCEALPAIVRLPMPRRSLLLLYGAPRYAYEHSIMRTDLADRRVCITYRELTPTFLSCGPKKDKGEEIVQIARQFWDHKLVYKNGPSLEL